MSCRSALRSIAALACSIGATIVFAQSIELATVVSRHLSRTIDLPGEIQPFLMVSLTARVPGYVERVAVDRGSAVRRGQLLVELRAPEMEAQLAQADAKAEAADADRARAQAQLEAATSTYERTKQAADTPGAVAGNELVQAEKQVAAAQAVVAAREHDRSAAAAEVRALRDLHGYLRITAPFDGMITERLVHPGALVGPAAPSPLVVLQQLSRLRLVVSVPEQQVAGIAPHATVSFTVPAYPGRTYAATVARLAHTLDAKTRAMSVELDVANGDGSLAPGMYPTVRWPIDRAQPALFVPRTSVVTTSERMFVVRDAQGRAEWVDVRKGAADGELVEVVGGVHAGDRVVKHATDEMRPGTPLAAR
jgi:membrane fusion protein, multidrug efflux system